MGKRYRFLLSTSPAPNALRLLRCTGNVHAATALRPHPGRTGGPIHPVQPAGNNVNTWKPLLADNGARGCQLKYAALFYSAVSALLKPKHRYVWGSLLGFLNIHK